MLSGTFERKLRKLNRKLRIFCRDNSGTPAGIFLLTPDGYEDICGIDKNYVPEHSEFNENGTLRKGGWRRVLRLLINRRLVDRFYAEKIFNTHLEYMPLIPRARRINPEEKKREFLGKYGALEFTPREGL
jgi:hypothetical protein